MHHPVSFVFVAGGLAFAMTACLQLRPQPVAGDDPDYRRGITHFHSYPQPWPETLAGLSDPWVRGGELIIWWANVEHEEGQFDWSTIDRDLEAWHAMGKRLDVRLSTAHAAADTVPDWLHERYHVRRVARGHWTDFEDRTADPYRLGSAAVVQAGAAAGGTAVGVDDRADPAPVVLTLGPEPRLDPGATYAVHFDVEAASSGECWVRAVTPTGGTAGERIARFALRRGERCSRAWTVTLGPWDDYRLEWGVTPGARIALDNVNTIRIELHPPFVDTVLSGENSSWIVAGSGRLQTPSPEREYVAGRAEGPGFHPVLRNDPDRFPIQQGRGYNVTFDCHALEDSTVRYRIVSESDPGVVIDEHVFVLAAGQGGRQVCFYPGYVWRPDCRVEIGLVGPGHIEIERVSYMIWSDRVPCFPNYFDPVFFEKWSAFVGAFAERYAGHPGLGIVSVGGFGRWEEVMLDEDVHGLLDPQWLACGFTQERYLEHVVACMDLYRRLMPDTRLRICLAYGLQHRNEVDWIYHRVADAAVARGIGLKQNGMSEKYDTWNEDTNGSYLFTRHRHRPGITLTHETGGQIYRNTANAHGYPVSLLNRALINGIDFLFLYGDDIQARHVRKYLHYAYEQMGRELFTTFYSRLGDYSLVNDHAPVPVQYRNVWLGVRQWDPPGLQTLYTTIDGERCAVTSGESNSLAFDVDDRYQYLGMHGVVLTVSYLDDAPGRFAVGCHNQHTGEWQVLGEVTRTGQGGWRSVSFPGSEWCRSSRNRGEDVHLDFVVHHLTEGRTTVRGVELSFVPARDWRRQDLLEYAPTRQAIRCRDSVSRTFDLPPGSLPCSVSIPLWIGSLDARNVTGRVCSVAPDTGLEQVLCIKDYAYPADGDRLELPFVPQAGGGRFRVELGSPDGDVGCYADSTGEMALRVQAYDAEPRSVFTRGPDVRGEFVTDAPLQAVRVRVTGGDRSLILERLMPDGVWTGLAEGSGAGRLRLVPEPQTPGRFRVRDTRGGAEDLTVEGIDALVRLVPPNPAGDPGVGESLWSADLGKAVSGLRRGPSSGSWTPTGDGIECVADGGRCTLEFELAEPLPARSEQGVVLRLRNRTPLGLARFWWAAPAAPFSAENSVLIPVVPNDTEIRTYAFPVGLEPGWCTPIGRVRLDPVDGLQPVGRVEVVSLALTAPEAVARWTFDSVPDTLLPLRDIAAVTREKGVLRVDMAGPDPVLQFPESAFEIQAATTQELRVQVRNPAGARALVLRWRPKGHPALSPHQALLGENPLSVRLPLASGMGVQTLTFPLGQRPGWQGHVTTLGLGIEGGPAAGDTGTLEILGIEISR